MLHLLISYSSSNDWQDLVELTLGFVLGLEVSPADILLSTTTLLAREENLMNLSISFVTEKNTSNYNHRQSFMFSNTIPVPI